MKGEIELPMGNFSCFPMGYEKENKITFDEKTLISWNDSSLIGQIMKQVWIGPLIYPCVNSSIIGLSVKIWGVRGLNKRAHMIEKHWLGTIFF